MAIANTALTMPPDRKDWNGRAYLPKGFPTLAATSLLETGQKENLQLTVTNDVDGWLAARPMHPICQTGAVYGGFFYS